MKKIILIACCALVLTGCSSEYIIATTDGQLISTDGKPKLEIAGKAEVPQGDPVIDAYRRKLSMALF